MVEVSISIKVVDPGLVQMKNNYDSRVVMSTWNSEDAFPSRLLILRVPASVITA